MINQSEVVVDNPGIAHYLNQLTEAELHNRYSITLLDGSKQFIYWWATQYSTTSLTNKMMNNYLEYRRKDSRLINSRTKPLALLSLESLMNIYFEFEETILEPEIVENGMKAYIPLETVYEFVTGEKYYGFKARGDVGLFLNIFNEFSKLRHSILISAFIRSSEHAKTPFNMQQYYGVSEYAERMKGEQYFGYFKIYQQYPWTKYKV